MKKRKKKINYAMILFTIGAITLWIMNFLGTERERLYIEAIFIVGYVPAMIFYLKLYVSRETKRVKALKRKIERDKKKSKKRVRA